MSTCVSIHVYTHVYTQVICSDKTGTLTTNKMKVESVLVPGAKPGTVVKYEVGGPPDFSPEGAVGNLKWGPAEQNMVKLAEVCVVCNQSGLTWDSDKNAYVKSGESTEAALKVLRDCRRRRRRRCRHCC